MWTDRNFSKTQTQRNDSRHEAARLMHALRMRKGALSTSASISKFLYQVAFGYSSRLQLFKSTSAIQVDFSYSLASRLRLFKSTSAIQGDFRYQKVSASRLGFPSRSFLLDCQSRREAKVVLLCLACHTCACSKSRVHVSIYHVMFQIVM